jgi:xanthine dehydrogenase accessory factor
MRPDLLALAADLSRARRPFAVAQVVRRDAPSSARVGDAALITADGAVHGWVGGSCTRPAVVREGLRVIAEGRPRLITLSPDPASPARSGATVYPMTCHSGGTVDIYVEPVLPAARLLVFGGNPVTRALARLARAMGYEVDAVAADAADVPEAHRVSAAPEAPRAGERVAAIVATFGEEDARALREALALAPSYLGVIASRVRFGQLREALLAQGVPAEALERISNPAGLDIGAETPEEIALSVLAEIVRHHRRRAREGAGAAAAPGPARGEPAEALDPVCGMTVAVQGARHIAVVDGRSWYFCGAGCRERFLADPARWSVAAGAPGGSA